MNKRQMNKVLILLPCANDQAEAKKLNKTLYDVHYLHASDDVKDQTLSIFDYDIFLPQPGFLTSYVDKAVEYVKENNITAIMFGHDMSSIVSSVVCEKTGLPGPSLESTFRSLHKYYSRKTAQGKLWVDYIDLDEPVDSWRDKVRYPCFLKPPFLTASKGCSCIRSEADLMAALAKVRLLVSPFFKGYCEFFQKYLNLEMFPLAVANIVVLEELVELGKEYDSDGWIDQDGNFTMFMTGDILLSPKKPETILAFISPAFSLNDASLVKLVKFTEEIGHKFALRNTFFNVEAWKCGDEFTLVEVNSRCVSARSDCYKKMLGMSAYEAAVHLASCGEIDIIREKKTALAHKDDEMISSMFKVYTWSEGKGEDFIDFEYARTGSISDGAFKNAGLGAQLSVAKDSLVKQTSSNGFELCSFFIVDDNVNRLLQRGKKIADKLLLQFEDRDIVEFPIIK